MITIDSLRAYGANVDEGLARCMNMTEFYLQMVGRAVDDAKIDELKNAVSSGDLDKAFELAHSMKGVFGNLSITPLFEPVSSLTELLRARFRTDYAPLLDEISVKFEQLKKLTG